MPALSFSDREWVWYGTYHERNVPRDARFRWDPTRKVWFTGDSGKARELCRLAEEEGFKDFAAQSALDEFDRIDGKLEERRRAEEAARREQEAKEEAERLAREAEERVDAAAVELSQAHDADIDVPVPDGLELLPFQRAGIAYASTRDAVLIGDEMGLGKTIEAIGALNLDPSIRQALVICPASLKRNWAHELQKWLTRNYHIIVMDPRGHELFEPFAPGAGEPVYGEVSIVNYDILARGVDDEDGSGWLTVEPWDLLIMDEGHYVKNRRAKRTRYVADIAKLSRRRFLLTGTPILNRPEELWQPLNILLPGEWPSYWKFVRRYADARPTRFGYDTKGHSNLEELHRVLRAKVMVRRLKSEVLTELPAKRRQIVELDRWDYGDLLAKEETVTSDHRKKVLAARKAKDAAKGSADTDAYRETIRNLRSTVVVAFTELSKLRHEMALAKVRDVAKHADDALRNTDKVVVFTHHKDALYGILDRLREHKPLALTGDTPQKERQGIVDAFQTKPEHRVFGGTIYAGGLGLTLTASSTVIFGELDWVPGRVTQAEDRCHRIGQQDSVNVYHLLVNGSLDAKIAKAMLKKQVIIDTAIDGVPDADSRVTLAEVLDLDDDPEEGDTDATGDL